MHTHTNTHTHTRLVQLTHSRLDSSWQRRTLCLGSWSQLTLTSSSLRTRGEHFIPMVGKREGEGEREKKGEAGRGENEGERGRGGRKREREGEKGRRGRMSERGREGEEERGRDRERAERGGEKNNNWFFHSFSTGYALDPTAMEAATIEWV